MTEQASLRWNLIDVVCGGVQVEQDLKFARFLAGLHGHKARKEVSELMNSVIEAGAALPLTEDKLITLMEAAQVHSS